MNRTFMGQFKSQNKVLYNKLNLVKKHSLFFYLHRNKE